MTNKYYKETMDTLIEEGAIGQIFDESIQPRRKDFNDILKVCRALKWKKHIQYACKPFNDTNCYWGCEACRNKDCSDRPNKTGCDKFIPEWRDLNPKHKLTFDNYVYRILKK